MTKFVRALLWVGLVLVASLIAMRLFAPEQLLRNSSAWLLLFMCFAAALSLSAAAAEFCGLDVSPLSFERLPSVFGAFGIFLALDTMLGTEFLGWFWDEPGTIPFVVVLFGGVIAYHVYKYRTRPSAR